jgi:hypothetical protein
MTAYMMGLQIVFSNHPRNPDKFLFGIESLDAIEELAKLFNKTANILLQGDITLQLPDPSKLANITIASTELNNILKNFAGKEIYIHPDVNSPYPKYSVSDNTLTFP